MSYRHTHVIFDIENRGKADSFIGRCHCGKEEIFATWWAKPLKGWSKKQWKLVVIGASLVLGSLVESDDSWSDEDMKKYLSKLDDKRAALKGAKKEKHP